MALTKYDIASSALVMIGANPVASFDAAGSTEQVACFHLYQTCVDHWISLFPWRFASKTTQLARDSIKPPTQWQASYVQPSGMKAMQAIRVDLDGNDIPYDRFENKIYCNAGDTQPVYCVHTYEPPIAWWPGYFVSLVEVAFAGKLSFALSGKLDLQKALSTATDDAFRFAKNADSRQQTSRRFKVTGRNSIMEFRRN
jgi:hypothetical protein